MFNKWNREWDLFIMGAGEIHRTGGIEIQLLAMMGAGALPGTNL